MSVKYYKQFAVELQNLPSNQRFRAVRQYLSSIEDDDYRDEAARYLVTFPTGADDSLGTVFVFLHGIRTGGAWQDRVAQMLQVEHQVTAIPIKYGVFNLWKFLVPPLRKRAVALAERHLMDVRQSHPESKLVIVAHSFGTYIIARLLVEKRCTVDRLLLCGSVVCQDFDWRKAVPDARRSNIVNDVGTKDIWPLLAHATSYGCGPSGYLGFGNPCVTDRYHPIRHSDFFTEDHIAKYWLPFLLQGIIVPSEHTEDRHEVGWLESTICSFPNAFVTLSALVIVSIALFSWLL